MGRRSGAEMHVTVGKSRFLTWLGRSRAAIAMSWHRVNELLLGDGLVNAEVTR